MEIKKTTKRESWVNASFNILGYIKNKYKEAIIKTNNHQTPKIK